jgi:hypothetical protein
VDGPPETVAALREKYARMLALRVAHARAKDDPGFVEPDPRREMAALAARFPGALREIDALPLATIRGRVAALDAVLRGDAGAEPWMVAQAAFHRLARGALAAKRWLASERRTASSHAGALADVRATFLADASLDGDARAWADDLGALARPPRGRLLPLVYARAAAELGATPAEIRALVFPPKRR